MLRAVAIVVSLCVWLVPSVARAGDPPLAPEPGCATPAPGGSPQPIGSVSVATRTTRALVTLPVPADLLTRGEIAATPGRTIESALAAIPGFAQTGTDARFTHPHDGSISLGGVGGGIGAAKALVLLDGVPVTNFNGGWVDWSRVPKLLVDRIEVVRGGASALYGTQAIGGVVAIETRVPRGREVAGDVFGGSLGTFGAALAVADRIGPHAAVSAYVDDQKADGFRAAVAPNPSQPTSRYRGQRAFVRGYFGPDDHQLELGTAAFTDHREGDSSGPSFFVGRSSFARYRATAQHGQALAATGAVDQTDYAFDLVGNTGASLGHSRLGWSTTSATVQDTFGERHLQITTGLDGRVANGHRDTLSAAGAPQAAYGGLQRGLGAFVQVDATAGRAELLASARYDAYAQGPAQAVRFAPLPVASPYAASTAHHVSPRFAARYTLSPALNLRASFADAFSAPNWNSLYGGFFIGGGVFFAGNPALRPETADRVEAGFDLAAGPRSRLALDVYRAGLENRTVFTFVNPKLFERINVGAARTAGYELSFQTELAPSWSFRAAAAIARGTILSAPSPAAVGKAIPQDPFQTSFAQLRFDDGRRTFALGARYAGTQYGDDANTLVYGNALLVDASASLAVGHGLQAYVEAQNLANRRYRADPTVYGPPSTLIVGLRRPLR